MKYAELIRKYNVPAPRYTSYPTVPYWEEPFPATHTWLDIVAQTFRESGHTQGISLYVHLPFCESLCTYCACNTRITKNHEVEKRYIQALLKEWKIYKQVFGKVPLIRELHLGGGTPTFFSAENLQYLVENLLAGAIVPENHEFALEGHPNNTTGEHLQVLHSLGFNRVSYGVQDLDLKVQMAINRIQPYANVKYVTEVAREIGYHSVNFDLIYGLPFQTQDSITQTIRQVSQLMPDRIAFYSYAHVPWIKPYQRRYTEADLPDNETKRALYEEGKKQLAQLDYVDIGMDHFALPKDALNQSFQNKTLHRNFMGYTTSATNMVIGLGASAISDARYAYAQNQKKVEDYYSSIALNKPAIFKGHVHTPEDRAIRKCISDITCKGEINELSVDCLLDKKAQAKLMIMEKEGLIRRTPFGWEITQTGHAFIRNICMLFDKQMNQKQENYSPTFSKAI